jgi:hypothetical protein
MAAGISVPDNTLPQATFADTNGVTLIVVADSGVANAYALLPSPPLTEYSTRTRVVLVPANANTGASTLSISGLAAMPIRAIANAEIVADELSVSRAYMLEYDGTSFQLIAVSMNRVDSVFAPTALSSTPLHGAVKTFAESGTWTKPPGARAVMVEGWGGGGGASGGTNAATTADAVGGGGGSNGEYVFALFRATEVGAAETVTIGAGGAGGAGGMNGCNGGTTRFGLLLAAYGGAGGRSASNVVLATGNGGDLPLAACGPAAGAGGNGGVGMIRVYAW